MAINRNNKHLYQILLGLAVMLVCLCVFAWAAADGSGTCGGNLNWELSNGILTITGSGNMIDYSLGFTPLINLPLVS